MSVYDFVSQGTPDDIVERYAALKNDAETSDFGVLDRNARHPRYRDDGLLAKS